LNPAPPVAELTAVSRGDIEGEAPAWLALERRGFIAIRQAVFT